MKRPRDYQRAAHDAVMSYLLRREEGNPLVVEATGLGKSLNIAMLIWHLATVKPGCRIVQLTHVKELVEGNYKELLGFWPSAPAGIYAAGLGRRERKQITFAMINSVWKKRFCKVDYVIIDEAHRMSARSESMYGAFVTKLRAENPSLRVIGYTATPFRMGMGSLVDGGLFDEVVYDIGGGESFVWAIENGYLIRPVPVDPGFTLDDSRVAISSTGDFKDSDASAALHEQQIIERAVDFTCRVAKDRKANLVFAQSIEDCEEIARMFTERGFPTMPVHSKRSDRDEVLRAFGAGELWGIVNKDILTTGSNFPRIDTMTVLRLTRSPGLWVQMVGRVTRPCWSRPFHGGEDGPVRNGEGRWNIDTKEGRLGSIAESHKQNALVLDFVGNTERLGPINYPNLPRPRGPGGGEPPVRKCPECNPPTLHHTSVKVCPFCGYEWPVKPKVKTKASAAQIVAEPKKDEEEILGVHAIAFSHHKGRDGKLDTMKTVYRCGHRLFPVWVCIEHSETSFPGRKARGWWKAHGGREPFPADVAEAVERAPKELRRPKFIKVRKSGKFWEVLDYDFAGTRFVLDFTGSGVSLHEPEPDPLAPPEPSPDMGGYFGEDFYF